MLSLYRAFSLRYWSRCRVRCGLVLLSIALGVATCLATSILDSNLEKAFRRSAVPLAGCADLYVSNGDAGVPAALADEVALVPGVHAVHPIVIQRVALPDVQHRSVLMLGADLSADSEASCVAVKVRDLTSQDYMRVILLRQKTVMVGQQLDQLLPPNSDHVRIVVAGQTQHLKRTGTIQARNKAAAAVDNMLVLSCADAAALLGRPDLVSRLDVQVEPGEAIEQVRQRIQDVLAGRAQAATPEQHGHWVEEMVAGLRTGFRLVGVAALAVGLFLVANVLAVSACERRHDIGILKSIGGCPVQVVMLFAGEAVFLGLLGSALGLPLGLGLAKLALGPVQQLVSEVFLPVQTGQLSVGPAAIGGAVFAGVITALLAAIVPALNAASVSAIESLRSPPPPSSHHRRLRWVAGMGLVACALGYLVRTWLPFRLGTFGTMVLVLVAGLLATPLLALTIARWLQPLARRWLGPAGRLALDNLVRSPGRTGLVITTLAAGVALFVQTGGFIGSNEKAIRSWVERSITGDLFVTSGGPFASTSGQNLPMSEGLLRRLETACPEAHVLPIRFRYLDWHRDGKPSRVLLFAMDAERFSAANEGRFPAQPNLDLYRRLREPGTALVSENFAALYGIHTGDPLTLPGADGPVKLQVIGTVEDYTCHRGTVIVDRSQVRLQFDAHLIDAFNLYLPPGANVEEVRQRIQQAPFAADQGFCILTRGELRAHILGMVLGLYSLAYGQEVMVAVVAVLGMVTALLLSVLRRRRELGLLRAVGATPTQVSRSVLAEALFMGILGTAMGLLAGIPLEWYTIRILLFAETGTLLPVQFPWATAAMICGVMLVGAALASLGPALRAGRIRIADALSLE